LSFWCQFAFFGDEKPIRGELRFQPAQFLAISFIAAILVGTDLFLLPFSTQGSHIPWIDALFRATSAVCVTGLVIHDTATYFTTAGQIINIVLVQMGGLGIMTFSTLILLVAGKRISIKERIILQQGFHHARPKALTEDHAKILDAVGATDVIFPEKDMAIKTALRLNDPNVLEYLPLISGISIQELAPPESFIGKSLKELDLMHKFGIQVIAVKELIPEKTTFVPKADFVIKDSDILVIIGEEEQLAKLSRS
jgi:hypothetical protein